MAPYAEQLQYDAVTLVMFAPVEDDAVLEQLSGEGSIDNIRVTVVAIG